MSDIKEINPVADFPDIRNGAHIVLFKAETSEQGFSDLIQAFSDLPENHPKSFFYTSDSQDEDVFSLSGLRPGQTPAVVIWKNNRRIAELIQATEEELKEVINNHAE